MVKVNLKSQSGRSMVEMLGVLAIVGVLSVGGVYGYGVASKKIKANELLHQASMQASSIASQIASGKTDLALENFGNSKYGTFGAPTKVNDEQFTLQITDMDSAVCEQMEKMAGGMVRKAECSETTLTLTYNNNLSTDKVAADYNGDEDGCKSSGRKYCANDTCIPSSEECPTGGACLESEKIKKTFYADTCHWYEETGNFCPDEEPPNAVYDPACDCEDEDCCKELNGSPACPYLGRYALCVPEGYSYSCDGDSIICPPGTTPVCKERFIYGNNGYKEGSLQECYCAAEGDTWDCTDYGNCIFCYASQGKATCVDASEGLYSNPECICAPDAYSWDCNDEECIVCEEGTAVCPEGRLPCFCVPEGYTGDSSYAEIKICSQEEGTALCNHGEEYASDGLCTCVPPGYSGYCGNNACITCSPEEGEPLCGDEDYGPCTCVPPGYSGKCNEEYCITCPNGQNATCDGYSGPCSCS